MNMTVLPRNEVDVETVHGILQANANFIYAENIRSVNISGLQQVVVKFVDPYSDNVYTFCANVKSSKDAIYLDYDVDLKLKDVSDEPEFISNLNSCVNFINANVALYKVFWMKDGEKYIFRLNVDIRYDQGLHFAQFVSNIRFINDSYFHVRQRLFDFIGQYVS